MGQIPGWASRTHSRRLGADENLAAFYADCRHETLPVKSGHRLALTYNLLVEGDTKPSDPAAERLDDLTEAVRKHFSDPRPPSWSGSPPREAPDKLVYLLDHEYTARDLSWKRLKNGDSRRVAALVELSRRLDCEIFLALAEVHETWSCEEEEYGTRERYRYYDEDSEDEEDSEDGDGGEGESPELIELVDGDIELRHYVDERGRKTDGVGAVADGELFLTVPSVSFEPFKAEHEGYMGNYGNTADRWYHRAAVVMWPKARGFVVRAGQSPAWALREIASALSRKEPETARERLAQLLPIWDVAVRSVAKPSLLGQTLALAARLDDPKSALALLVPFSLTQVTSANAPRLVRALRIHAPALPGPLFNRWLDSNRIGASLDDWIAKELPGVCRIFVKEWGSEGDVPARALLDSLWKRVSEGIRLIRGHGPKAISREFGFLIAPLLALMESGGITGYPEIQADIIGFLTKDGARLPIPCLVKVLQTERKRGRNALDKTGLMPLAAYCRAALEKSLGAPMRDQDDWSITVSLDCRCDLCKQLGRFLAASGLTRKEWPLAQHDRAHVHGKIDQYELPVLHATRRTGRPFTLILEKTQALFARETGERAEAKKLLAWLG